MKTTTSFEKFKGEISIIVKIGESDSLRYHLSLSEDDAQELLLQLGDVLMQTQGHVQTGRPVGGSVPKKFIMDTR